MIHNIYLKMRLVEKTNFELTNVNSSKVVRSSIRSTSMQSWQEPRKDVLLRHALSSKRRVIEDSMG